MKNKTRRIFLRNTSLAATGVIIISPLGATNKTIKNNNSASVGCAPKSFNGLTSTVASTQSGNWSDPATWGGKTPGPKDIVQISSNDIVLYDLSQTAVSGLQISPSASLVFDPSKSTVLESSANLINEGILKMHPSSLAVTHTLRFINVAEAAFKGGGMDPLTTDIGLWVINNGQLDLIGAPKTSWARASDTIQSGSTRISLQAQAQGWNAGDQISITPTDAPTNPDFVTGFTDSIIDSVSGSSISLGVPVSRSHPKVNNQWTAEVMNLTRNVRIEGTPAGRSHIFIRSGKIQTLKYVQLRYMGPRKDTMGDRVTELVLGRYALHFHHSMDGSRGSVVEGCVIRDTGNHCFVPHVSHGILFKNNIAYNVTETAFWWDEKDPSHDIIWDGNIVALCKYIHRSMNVHTPVNPGVFAPTFSASGFLMGKGDDNIVVNNVAVGCAGDPQGGAAFNWEADSEGVWKFENNLAHNNDCGLRVWQVTPRHHVVKKFIAYYNGTGIFHGAYANSYKYTSGHLYGNNLEVKAGSTDTNRVRIENMIIDGAGLVDHCVRNMESPLAGTMPTHFLNCTIKNSRKAAISNENVIGQKGPLVKGMDFVFCNVTGSYIIDPNVSPLEFIRIQNLTGQSIKMTKQGQTNIASFAPTSWGTGDGLSGEYFNKKDFTNHVFTRTDYNVSFPYWADEVHYKITGLSYSVRWTGQIQPQFTEDHIFQIRTGGGVKLWIDNTLILEAKDSYPDDYRSPSFPMEAGKKYDIKIEYFNTGKRSEMGFMWQSKSLPLEYVPQSQLYASKTTTPPPPVTNQPPVANAGADITIVFPVTKTILDGSGSTPAASIKSYEWSKISGPGVPNIRNKDAVSSEVKDLVEGTYVFRLQVKDVNGLITNDEVIVAVKPANTNNNNQQPVIANAGSDILITLPINAVILNGSATSPSAAVKSYEWTKISGPGQASIGNQNMVSTSVKNLIEGIYIFRLKVTDQKGIVVQDDVQVTVKPQPPSANAGSDTSIALPANSVVLNGSGSFAPSGIKAYEWTKISGPGNYRIINKNAISPVIKDLVTGTYIFRLQITDKKGTTSIDEVSVTVKTGNGRNEKPGEKPEQPEERKEEKKEETLNLNIKASPNPSLTTSDTILEINSNSNLPITVGIYNRWGKCVARYTNIRMNATIRWGAFSQQGTYYALAQQGHLKKTVKLIKL